MDVWGWTKKASLKWQAIQTLTAVEVWRSKKIYFINLKVFIQAVLWNSFLTALFRYKMILVAFFCLKSTASSNLANFMWSPSSNGGASGSWFSMMANSCELLDWSRRSTANFCVRRRRSRYSALLSWIWKKWPTCNTNLSYTQVIVLLNVTLRFCDIAFFYILLKNYAFPFAFCVQKVISSSSSIVARHA